MSFANTFDTYDVKLHYILSFQKVGLLLYAWNSCLKVYKHGPQVNWSSLKGTCKCTENNLDVYFKSNSIYSASPTLLYTQLSAYPPRESVQKHKILEWMSITLLIWARSGARRVEIYLELETRVEQIIFFILLSAIKCSAMFVYVQ